MFVIEQDQRAEVARLCTEFSVRRLDLFGSATSDEFDPATSDLDFVVTFEPKGWKGAADRYFGLQAALQSLFGRPVDLVEERAIRNRVFRRELEKSRSTLYAA